MFYWANEEKTGIVRERPDGSVIYMEPGEPEYDAALAQGPQPPKIFSASLRLTADEWRQRRDAELAATDFRMVPDAPWDRDAWATYRQALRDITEQAGFPQDVAWPEKP